MKKIIFILSLFLSIWGIFISFFVLFLDFKDLTDFTYFILGSEPYHYSGLDIYIVTERTSKHSYKSSSLPLINLFFYLSFVGGSIIYYFSKYKESKLLLFNYSLLFLNSIIKISCFTLPFKIAQSAIYPIYILLTIVYLYISYLFLTKYLDIKEGEDLENASNYKRFLNLFIDSFIIIIITSQFINYAEQNEQLTTFFSFFKTTFSDKSGVFVFFCLIKFIYYLIFESIFKSTPAKFLTACYITDESGNSPNFSMILKRTLFRFIPFESLSFLLKKDLHDNYSDTYVINKKTEPKTEKKYLQILSICFFIMLVIYFFNLSERNNF